ncbi:MAG: DUF503 domain-containing protein [Candidatus Latescibacterota bacterium]|nr:DUF503 domain-containing protein [Candidatus Latescibacterota bacterium]
MSCVIQIYIGESRSLKDKRQVISSLKERIRNRFNASVAEVADQELWQRAELGVAVVSSAVQHCDEMLAKIVNFIEGDHRVQLLDYQMEVR